LTDWSGAVLTGGASRRMGHDKATLEIDGEAMAARVANSLRAAGAAEVFCVGGDVAALGLASVPDEHPGAGPLGALVTALEAASHDLVVVLACDLLEPSADLIARLVATVAPGQDATIPVVDDRAQWLHGAWSRDRALDPLRRAFAAGERAIHRAAEGIDVRFVTESGPGFADADSPGDIPGDR
jgi:molybdopterin-guanine dinucleotide biosynthesis protein A